MFLAGGVGASLRLALVTWVDRRLAAVLPAAGTLTVNVVGCFVIGLGAAVLPPGLLRPVLLGGLLGGFTTYSAFGLLSWTLIEEGRTTAFATQVLLHLVLGLAAVWLGLMLGRAIAPPPAPEG